MKQGPDHVDLRLGAWLAPAARRLERVERVGERERLPLGDERAEPARDSRQLLDLCAAGHLLKIVIDLR